MKRWFSLILLMGALFGLFAQEAAFAAGPVIQLTQQNSTDASMDADCMEAMVQSDDSSDRPCKGLTLDCIAKMGCAVPLAQTPAGYDTANLSLSSPVLTMMAVNPMIGRNEAPIPDPPSDLG